MATRSLRGPEGGVKIDGRSADDAGKRIARAISDALGRSGPLSQIKAPSAREAAQGAGNTGSTGRPHDQGGSEGGAAGPGGYRPYLNLAFRAGMYGVGAAGVAGSHYASTAHAPGGSARLAGQGVSAAGQHLGDGLLQAGQAAGSTGLLGLGALASVGLGGIGLAMRAVGAGMDVRMRRVRQMAGLELPRSILMESTGAGRARFMAALHTGGQYGFAPEQSAQMTADFYRQVGRRGAESGALTRTLFGAAASGVAPSALARYLALGGAGGGARSGHDASLSRAIGFAQSQGMTGARVEELLTRISLATGHMAERGLSVDTRSLLARAQGLSRGGLRGMEALRGAIAEDEIPKDAASILSSPFKGLAQMAMIAQAASHESSMEGMLRHLEGARTEDVTPGLRMMLGDDLAAMALRGTGHFSMEGAQQAIGAPRGLDPPGGGFTASAENFDYSARLADLELGALREVGLNRPSNDPVHDANKRLLEATYGVERTMLQLGEFGDVFAKMTIEVNKALQGLLDVIRPLVP